MPQRRIFKSPLDRAKSHEVIWDEVSDVFTFARRVEGICFVYFIGEEDGGPVKIGTATDPIVRLRGMQTGNPRRLRLERVLVGNTILEKTFHRLWQPFVLRPQTEWFKGEIREPLYPIVETAVIGQLDYFANFAKVDSNVVNGESLDERVREAHRQHDFVGTAPDRDRYLAPTSGLRT